MSIKIKQVTTPTDTYVFYGKRSARILFI